MIGEEGVSGWVEDMQAGGGWVGTEHAGGEWVGGQAQSMQVGRVGWVEK